MKSDILNELSIILLAWVAIIGACNRATFIEQRPENPQHESARFRSVKFCDVGECAQCDPTGKSEVLPQCPEDSGWLCCSDDLAICTEGSGTGSCPFNEIDLWCDYYEVSDDGSVECFDEWGQG